MLTPYLNILAKGQDLTETEAAEAMTLILEGKAHDIQIGAFLAMMRIKGETLEELWSCAEVMRDHALPIFLPENMPAVDTCGTGGDGAGIFNVSTLAACVTAANGIVVPKHGNRAVSGKTGSADLLEALGATIILAPEKMTDCLNTIGFAFLFAPLLHPAMKYAMPTRRALNIRTLFNLLGPLSNPARVRHQVLGVFSLDLIGVMAHILKHMGTKRALVVHSQDGLDELSIHAPTEMFELSEDGNLSYKLWDPKVLGLNPSSREALEVHSLEESVAVAHRVLDGESGALGDMVALNAGAAIYIVGKADSISDGFFIARKTLESGAAKEKMRELIRYTYEGDA